MAEASDESGILLLNLRDAGCDREFIQRCIELADKRMLQRFFRCSEIPWNLAGKSP